MNRAIIKKYLLESQWLLLACTAAMYFFCWIRVWTIGLLDMGQLSAIVDQIREFERFSPVPFDQLLTYAGRVAVVYDEPVVVVSMSLWAIARGTDAVSGEVGRGTMEMLLAQPVSRAQVLLTQAAVTLLGVAVLASASWLGTWTGIMTTTVKETVEPPPVIIRFGIPLPNLMGEAVKQEVPLSERVDAETFVPASSNLFCLGVFLAAFSTLVSSWDQHRGRTIGLVVGVFVVSLTFKILGMAHDDLAWLKSFSFLTSYDPERFVMIAVNQPGDTWNFLLRGAAGEVTGVGPLGHDLLLLGLGVVSYGAALLIFCRRDIPAPL